MRPIEKALFQHDCFGLFLEENLTEILATLNRREKKFLLGDEYLAQMATIKLWSEVKKRIEKSEESQKYILWSSLIFMPN